MIGPALVAGIRRLWEIEGWRPIRRAVGREGIELRRVQRASAIDPFVGFLRESLERHPDLSASVLWEMVPSASTACSPTGRRLKSSTASKCCSAALFRAAAKGPEKRSTAHEAKDLDEFVYLKCYKLAILVA